MQSDIHLDSAVTADKIEQGDWEVEMQNQIEFKSGIVLFGQVTSYDEDDKATATDPVVGFKTDGRLYALKIDDTRLKNAGWSYISAGPGKDEFWGVLDASLDDKQDEIVLVHSTDGGKTMHLSSLEKPMPVMVFDSFCMDRNGHGRVTVYGDQTKTRLKHAGYYNFHTTDDGQDWTGPQFEPDAMTPADDVPDESNKPAEKPSRV